jgi:hypothetical protein
MPSFSSFSPLPPPPPHHFFLLRFLKHFLLLFLLLPSSISTSSSAFSSTSYSRGRRFDLEADSEAEIDPALLQFLR